MIKALIFDLDRTLLNSDKKITVKTKATLIACKEKGIKLFLATARLPYLNLSLSWSENDINIFDGGVFYNGGCVQMNGKNQYFPITNNIVKSIINQVHEYDNLNISLQLEYEIHAFRFPLDKNGIKTWAINAEKALSLDQAKELNIIKILIFYANLTDSKIPIKEKLVKLLSNLCKSKAHFCLTDKGKVIQITAKDANKLSGIEKIRTALKLKKDEIVVFGDDFNDIEMLSAYKYSVAMGNAEEEIKKCAKYITLDNDSDGIYYALQKILKII